MRKLHLFLIVLFIASCGKEKPVVPDASYKPTPIELPAPEPVPPASTVKAKPEEHIVKYGEFLISIAEHYNVNWEALLLCNEKFLQEKYEETCKQYSRNYRDNARRRGHFCNDRLERPYGNTLLPGWKLLIPADTAPTEIVRAVINIKGNNVAIVIDDTGSMNNDRQRVSEWYMAALHLWNKNIAGVWLFRDGQIRRYQSGGVTFQTVGVIENTHAALMAAAAVNPDAIILVTDEPGDDWNWETVRYLPPVVGHCTDTADQRFVLCQQNLQRLAKETNGQYITGL